MQIREDKEVNVVINLKAAGITFGIIAVALYLIAAVVLACGKGEYAIVNMVWAGRIAILSFISLGISIVTLVLNGLLR